ncbi:MAG: sulfatase [Verrucomicrobiales bacterium]|nr:sulfatase [Verrucomicrobiales bacterium]|tara:strand:- start:22761 stop:24200 length:1440 start_codon:yes stop_codon:yes gene_type:complete
MHTLSINRRHFFGRTATGIGTAALASLLNENLLSRPILPDLLSGKPGVPHLAPKAKRVIYMYQSGAPSQVDLFDDKPSLEKLNGQNLPDSIRQGQRLTGMTSRQKSFPAAKSFTQFNAHGQSGIRISDLLPWHAKIVDDMCLIRSMHTEAINHDPAITFFQTGHQQPGRPSLGAWASYGLGSANKDLPAFVVLHSKCTDPQAQPLYARLWGSGFLPSNHQGVKFRAGQNPVLYLNDPTGDTPQGRRQLLDSLAELNTLRREDTGNPEIDTRIAAYEMAHRMQMSVPELTDLSKEPASTFKLYGEDARIPGTHAANCLLARRLAERDVRFIQLYHRGWDHHSGLPGRHPKIARETDQGSAALVMDLKERGLLKDTLIIWGGEFGRTVYRQGGNATNYGRDHHPRCFSLWMAGGGIKGGTTHGETDDWCYNVAKDPVHVHDLNATILHLLGIDHEKLTHRYQGRDYRLTDVHGKVVKPIIA